MGGRQAGGKCLSVLVCLPCHKKEWPPPISSWGGGWKGWDTALSVAPVVYPKVPRPKQAADQNAVSRAPLGRRASARRALAQATLAARLAARAASHTSHNGRDFAVGTTRITRKDAGWLEGGRLCQGDAGAAATRDRAPQGYRGRRTRHAARCTARCCADRCYCAAAHASFRAALRPGYWCRRGAGAAIVAADQHGPAHASFRAALQPRQRR